MEHLAELILTNMQAMESRLHGRFDGVERQLVTVNERLDALEVWAIRFDRRLSNVEKRLTRVEGRLTNVEDRLTNVEDRLTNVEDRLTNVEDRVSRVEDNVLKLGLEFEEFRSDMRAQWEVVRGHGASVADHETRITFLEEAS